MKFMEHMMNLLKPILGYRIVGKINEREKEKINSFIAEKISSIDEIRTEKEIKDILDKGNIMKIEPVYSKISSICPAGIYQPNTNNIYLHGEVIDALLDNTPEFMDLNVVIHENIHKIQKTKLLFRGKDVRGLVEGATEYATQKILNEKRSHVSGMNKNKIRYNMGQCSYQNNVSIVEQLDIVLGNNEMLKYALDNSNNYALKKLTQEYGKDFFETIRNASAKLLKDDGSDEKELLKQVQDTILYTCYEKKYANIKTKEEAIEFLKELKRLNLARAKIEGDESLEQFYKEKYKVLQEKFLGKDLQDLKYTEPEFYPCYLNKEEKEYAIKRWLIPIGERNAEDLDSIKAYRIQENDKWCQLITKNGEPIEFFEISDYEPIDSKVLYKKDKGLYGIKEPNSPLEDSSIQIAYIKVSFLKLKISFSGKKNH